MNPARALTYLKRRAALPLPDEEKAISLAAAMLLEIYLDRARRSLHLEERTAALAATGAALPGEGAGEHEPPFGKAQEVLADPPFNARLAACVEPAGSKG